MAAGEPKRTEFSVRSSCLTFLNLLVANWQIWHGSPPWCSLVQIGRQDSFQLMRDLLLLQPTGRSAMVSLPPKIPPPVLPWLSSIFGIVLLAW